MPDRSRPERSSPWERLPTEPGVAVIWDREGERFTGYLSDESFVRVLQINAEFLLAMTEVRLAHHAAQIPGDIDPRLDALLEMRRQTWHGEPSELEILIPMANRYRRVIDCLADAERKVVLDDFTARHDLGVTAIDAVQLLDRWLLALSTGEMLDDGVELGPDSLERFATMRDWVSDQIVSPLAPSKADPVSRYGAS